MMPAILPSMNTVWFWFDKTTRRLLHGTPADVMRKFELFQYHRMCEQGIEIFLMPNQLKSDDEFTPSFYKKSSRLGYKAVHIGDNEQDFLFTSPAMDEKLSILGRILQRLEADIIVVHAHHLRNHRKQIKDLLLSSLPGIHVYVENNGFDNEWGHTIEGLTEIFQDCSEFYFCLDIAHVKDYKDGPSLDNILKNEFLVSRIREIHWSYSTIQLEGDTYAGKGYPGYNPYHALFSVVGEAPSERTKAFVKNYPVIVEGIVPREDRFLDFLRQEIQFLE